MSERIEVDLCVIGAGHEGSAVAATAAALGASVVLVAPSGMPARGLADDLPRAAFVAFARRMAARGPMERGSTAGLPAFDIARLRDRIEAAGAVLRPNDSPARVAALGARIIRGEARFLDRDTIAAGDVTIKARRFVLATGSRPALPGFPGLADMPALTEDRFLAEGAWPEHVLIVGSGSAAIECAQAYRRLGAAVTLVATGAFLPEHDPETAALVRRALAAEGVAVVTDAAIDRVGRDGEGVRADLRRGEQTETLRASHLLVASGRAPDLDGLALAAAGIAFGPGGIAVDRQLTTSNRRVFAIGPCAAGAFASSHGAARQASLVLRAALFRLPIRFQAEHVARLTSSDPQIASVGLDEAAARAAHGAIRILRAPFAENARAVAEGRREGHIKAITDRKGRILGCSIVGYQAGEAIAPWVLALSKGLKITDIADLALPHATYGEASQRAALEFLRPQAQNPWLRRLVAVMRRFG